MCFFSLKHFTCLGCVLSKPIGVNVAVQIETFRFIAASGTETPSHVRNLTGRKACLNHFHSVLVCKILSSI